MYGKNFREEETPNQSFYNVPLNYKENFFDSDKMRRREEEEERFNATGNLSVFQGLSNIVGGHTKQKRALHETENIQRQQHFAKNGVDSSYYLNPTISNPPSELNLRAQTKEAKEEREKVLESKIEEVYTFEGQKERLEELDKEMELKRAEMKKLKDIEDNSRKAVEGHYVLELGADITGGLGSMFLTDLETTSKELLLMVGSGGVGKMVGGALKLGRFGTYVVEQTIEGTFDTLVEYYGDDKKLEELYGFERGSFGRSWIENVGANIIMDAGLKGLGKTSKKIFNKIQGIESLDLYLGKSDVIKDEFGLDKKVARASAEEIRTHMANNELDPNNLTDEDINFLKKVFPQIDDANPERLKVLANSIDQSTGKIIVAEKGGLLFLDASEVGDGYNLKEIDIENAYLIKEHKYGGTVIDVPNAFVKDLDYTTYQMNKLEVKKAKKEQLQLKKEQAINKKKKDKIMRNVERTLEWLAC